MKELAVRKRLLKGKNENVAAHLEVAKQKYKRLFNACAKSEEILVRTVFIT